MVDWFWLACIECGAEYPSNSRFYRCPKCSGLLEVRLDLEFVSERTSRDLLRSRPLGVWRYREFLPVGENARIVSLGEGGTPLYRCDSIGGELGVELYVKFEGANPTGSFKDRGMTLGVTKALELGARAVACASTGNTSASLAAYSAKAGIPCYVLLPKGKVALGKLVQAMLHGARVVAIRGNFDQALSLVIEFCEKHDVYLLNSVNPWRLEGQKTEAFEIVDQLDWNIPDAVVVPMGNCGNISAIWKGFVEMREAGIIDELPRMYGVQAEGACPVARAIIEGRDEIEPVANPETVATAIRIGNPVNAPKAIRAIRESGGYASIVSDEEILAAQRDLARREGIGVEPASAASLAGLRKLLESGEIDRGERIVCIATGHALKDPDIILRSIEKPLECDPNLDSLLKVLGNII